MGRMRGICVYVHWIRWWGKDRQVGSHVHQGPSTHAYWENEDESA